MADFTPRYLADYQTADFSIDTIDLTFDLSDTKTIVSNVMVMKKNSEAACDLILDGEHITLKSIQLNEKLLDEHTYQVTDNQLTVLDAVLPNETFTLTIVTEINPQENTSLEGLFKSGDAFCTQCEAEGFRRITYYFDRPDVMAIFSTKVIADKSQFPFLLSNGNKIAEGELTQGKHFVKWHDPFPKPCYLFALVAGNFDCLQDSFTTCSGKNVALEIFVDKGNLAKATHAMQALKDAMTWDEQTFGLEYDLDIYMIVAVDFFNMGAMENKGLNVFNSKYVLADENSATDVDYFNIEAVIAHEYFHNWTGNRVTCRDWFQLSLKEGLTVFRDQQFSADMHSSAVTRIQNVRVLRSLQFAEDAGPMAHPIRPEEVLEMNNFYTLTVYEKGAEVIRMLHTLLGKDNFRKGMDLYFKRFDGMAVTCDDFIDAMADAANISLTQFKEWYRQSGTPTVTVTEVFDEKTNQYQLTLAQEIPTKTTGNSVQPPLHLPVRIELIDLQSGLKSAHLLQLTETQQTWVFENYSTKPTLALLEDFSAPVKLNHHQSDQTLSDIMVHASNAFCRWDAGQTLLMSYLKKLTIDKHFVLPQQLIGCFETILTSSEDHAFIAEQLILPSFDEAADLITQVDPQALVNAIDALTLFLAKGLEKNLVNKYQECCESSSAQAVSDRALKNVCLRYLSVLENHQDLVVSQFNQALLVDDNMTDTLGALHASAKGNLAVFYDQMQQFEQKWQNTTLVMDKWFSLQANLVSDDIFEHLDTLQKHPLFSLKNPNRARSLISAFSSSNPKYFHCDKGRGYKFLGKQIALLNEINPQVASRLITPLIQFKSFAQPYSELMKEQLIYLQKLPDISRDLKEKLDAALA